jgi:AraC family ethanolamine operon transcriptional activator
MSSPLRNDGVLVRNFCDIDEYAESLSRVEWDLDLKQLGRGMFRADTKKLILGPFLVNHMKINRSFLIQGQMPGELSAFGFPVSMKTNGTWMRRPFGPETIQRYAQGNEFEAVTPANFETITITLLVSNNDSAYPLRAEENQIPESDTTVSIGSGGKLKQNFIPKIIYLLNRLQSHHHYLENQSFVADYSERISELLRQIQLVEKPETCISRGWTRSAALKRAEEYINIMEGEPITIQELRKHAKTSRSTLERAFREHYGVLPKTYLMSRRLNGVRRMLKEADPATCKISEAANRWGFWHMGQFAADYRRQFGELPSDTLSRFLYM